MQKIKIKTLFIKDDQVTVTDSDDSLHIYIHKLEIVTPIYGLQNFKKQKKIIALKIRVAIGSNIIKHDNTSVSPEIKDRKKRVGGRGRPTAMKVVTLSWLLYAHFPLSMHLTL